MNKDDFSKVFSLILNVIAFASDDLQELLKLRFINSNFCDAIDNHSPSTWNRLLTEENYEKAFKIDNVYVIRQHRVSYSWIIRQFGTGGRNSANIDQIPKYIPNDTLIIHNTNARIDEMIVKEGIYTATRLLLTRVELCNSFLSEDIISLRRYTISGVIESFENILKLGANPNEKGVSGKTVFETFCEKATDYGSKYTKLFFKYGAKLDDKTFLLALKSLTKRPLPLYVPGKDGSVYKFLAPAEKVQHFYCFLDNGANIHIKSPTDEDIFSLISGCDILKKTLLDFIKEKNINIDIPEDFNCGDMEDKNLQETEWILVI